MDESTRALEAFAVEHDLEDDDLGALRSGPGRRDPRKLNLRRAARP